MRIYTKTGDKGQTSLASGLRVSKASPALEAYGTADELNSFVGLLRAKLAELHLTEEDEQLEWIQNKLFNLGADLAQAEGEWIVADDVCRLEGWLDAMQEELEPMKGFFLPGGSETIALCHVCRTVTRRLERRMVELWQALPNEQNVEKNAKMLQFVNRLSDFWFQIARKMAKKEKKSLFLWKK